MIGRQGSRRLVLALDKAAKAVGIRPGTPVSKAQALVPGLVVEDLDAAADARALQQLAFHFLRIYAPIVAADPPDGLVLDTAGADHLHGNETLMLSGMVNRLHAAGFAARAAIADSWGRPMRLPGLAVGRSASYRRAGSGRRSAGCLWRRSGWRSVSFPD